MTIQKTVLIVDDEPAIRMRSQAILAKEFRVALAENGRDALDQLSSLHPDLILLDVDMPELDGLKTCRLLREDPLHRFTKVIFLSGRVSLEERLLGYQAGADDYICKPFDADELLAKVRIMMRLKNEEELSTMKSSFLSLIAHETKNPLNGVIGLAQLLTEVESEQDREMAEMILASGNWLLDFVQKAALICELQAGKRLYLEQVPIAPLLRKAISNQDLAEKGLSISLNDDYNGEVQADQQLIGKVFEYVINNAVRFSPENGAIQVNVAPAKESRCVIEIADQGDGIDSDRLEKVFDLFAIKDVNHHHQGQGLSLAAARLIIELYGGTIKARNGSGKGAVFTINLPGLHGREQSTDKE